MPGTGHFLPGTRGLQVTKRISLVGGLSMPFIIRCVKCQRKLRVLDRLHGKLVRCPACLAKFVAQPSGHPAVAATPAMARPRPFNSPSGSRTAPPSSKVPLSRPAPNAPPSSKVPASPRVPSSASVEDVTVDHGEDEFMAGSGAMNAPARPLDDLEPTAPKSSKSGVRRRRQTPLVNVFATLGGVLLLTTLLGLAIAFWVNNKVQWLQQTPASVRPAGKL